MTSTLGIILSRFPTIRSTFLPQITRTALRAYSRNRPQLIHPISSRSSHNQYQVHHQRRTISSNHGWIGQSTSTTSTTTTPTDTVGGTQTPPQAPNQDSQAPQAQETPKGSRFSRMRADAILYWKNLLGEYKIVLIEAYEDGLSNPTRTTGYLILLGGLLYLIWSNPSEESFFTEFKLAREDFDVVGEPVRSPKSEQYVRALTRLEIRGELRYSDLVLFSIIWRDDVDREVGLFEARCKYLQPAWSEMWDRLIDIGFGGRWWLSRRMMTDYDVNEWEWETSTKTTHKLTS